MGAAILAVTGVLIAKVDRPADSRIQSISLQQTAGRWSNIVWPRESDRAALAYGIGCGKHHSYLRDTGFKAPLPLLHGLHISSVLSEKTENHCLGPGP